LTVYDRLYDNSKRIIQNNSPKGGLHAKLSLNEFSKNFRKVGTKTKKKKKMVSKKFVQKESASSDSNFDSVEREADFDEDLDELNS
jgi:hypothetical protein